MWPALILAIKRTPKVKGRIKLLIVSIKTRNGTKAEGHPLGARLPKYREGDLKMSETVRETQNPTDRVAQNQNCLVKAKVKGVSPAKLQAARKKKSGAIKE